MQQILCPHCGSPIDAAQRSNCPFCAESLQNTNPAGALSFASLLDGRYTVGRFLQADGEGITYEALNNATGEKVMLREYLPLTLTEGRDEQGALEAKAGREVLFKTNRMDFEDLYRNLKRITPCTGLVTVLDVFSTGNTVYAVSEICQGKTLKEYLAARRTPLKPDEVRSLLLPVLEGVALLHKESMVHRGISPENIFILQGDKACLGGYATLGLRTRGSELKEKLYEGYSAPEQYAPEQFAGRYTDVYALAAVFYRMVTGQTPVSAVQRQVKDSLPTARELESSIPGYVSAVLSHAMRLEPNERIQNVPELMGVLVSQNAANSFLQKETKKETNSVFDEKEKTDRTHSYFAPLMIVLVAICVMLVILCVILWKRESREVAAESSSAVSESQAVSSEVVPDSYVPNVVGRKYTDLGSDSTIDEKYRFYVAERRYDSEVEEGVILQQSPEPGTAVNEGGCDISLVVSKGPELVEMPYILGFTQENAEAELNNLGIRFSLLTLVNNGEYVSGCVASTDIEAGTKIDVHNVIVNVYIAGERPLQVLEN